MFGTHTAKVLLSISSTRLSSMSESSAALSRCLSASCFHSCSKRSCVNTSTTRVTPILMSGSTCGSFIDSDRSTVRGIPFKVFISSPSDGAVAASPSSFPCSSDGGAPAGSSTDACAASCTADTEPGTETVSLPNDTAGSYLTVGVVATGLESVGCSCLACGALAIYPAGCANCRFLVTTLIFDKATSVNNRLFVASLKRYS